MSQHSAIADLLARRRDRAIAIVLGIKERECDRYLPPVVQAKLRKVILDQMNELFELCVDVTRSLDDGNVGINELYLEKLDALHNVLHSGMEELIRRLPETRSA